MNKITFQYDNDDIIRVGENITEAMKKAIDRVIFDCKVEIDCDIAVTFTDNEGIREINNNYRGIDSETDVLSFPMLEYEKPGAIFASPDDFEDGKLVLGDIVVSVPKAQAQAQEYGHSEEREFAFLAAHSTLHLLGYDHMTEAEETVMFDKQEKALAAIGLTR